MVLEVKGDIFFIYKVCGAFWKAPQVDYRRLRVEVDYVPYCVLLGQRVNQSVAPQLGNHQVKEIFHIHEVGVDKNILRKSVLEMVRQLVNGLFRLLGS